MIARLRPSIVPLIFESGTCDANWTPRSWPERILVISLALAPIHLSDPALFYPKLRIDSCRNVDCPLGNRNPVLGFKSITRSALLSRRAIRCRRRDECAESKLFLVRIPTPQAKWTFL
ncbi:hypothetical protein BDV37DRAFT_246521 [Aspergillus pseudonomiae]|uniref:Uncharacterized protein n=1 Tax=Aspergillus pseudonomiae TaxID=1506151 RepID=A0A5N7DF58_9EURO|nr:uncharacterized protein BDV37DRAFT_246521 [Aspergillus pseudonomiae]KAE8404894.1 hypothetical protein BDV37DRAFT_246521 [Aspergillus pseudonomiae]